MADVHNPAAPPPAAGSTGDGTAGTPPEHGEKKVPEKTFSQAEFDAALDAQVATAVAKSTAAFAGVDVAEYKKLKAQEFDRTQKELAAKGQFEQLLANTVKEKDAALEKSQTEAADQLKELTSKLERSEVDAKLLAAAHKAHSPDQVAALLRSSIKFDPKSGVMVVDPSGNPVAKNGKPITIDEHVSAFLEANPHFLPATPGGAGSQGSADTGSPGAAAATGDPVMTKLQGQYDALKAGRK